MDEDVRVALVVANTGVGAAENIGHAHVVVRLERGRGVERGRAQEAERFGRARLHAEMKSELSSVL